MTQDNAAHSENGHWRQPASRSGHGQGTNPGRIATRQLDHGPGTPGSGPRFLVAHARWITAVTLAVVAAATAFALSRTPLYRSQADVIVQAPSATAAAPDMGTEESIVSSGVVLNAASQATGVPATALADGLSVTARGTSFVLQISYSNPNPHVAQQRAQAIAQAYTAFRAPKPAVKSSTPSGAPTAQLVTSASLPTAPYSPDYAIDLVAALIIGLALALGTAWLRDYFDDHLRGPFDLERQTDADVLAMIPAFRPAGPEPGHRLVMALSPHSVVAEAYRGLRTRVLLAMSARNSRTVLVTSPAWEDRATVAANLAAALAQSGYSTVLACADLRWGAAHLVVGTWEDGRGLTGLLERRTDLADALQPTRVPGLQLLPPGALPLDPAVLLQRSTLSALLDEIRGRADVVVIEAPPLLASPGTRPLTEAAGTILLVADTRVSTRAQARAAARELEQDRARLAGCVLVNVGKRQRLAVEQPDDTYDITPNGRSLDATAGDGSQAPLPGDGLSGAGTEITEEFQWPNRS